MKQQIVLVILDGWGVGKSWGGNALTIAQTPNYNQILRTYPNTIIAASGQSVGLPGNEVGNSEVGHMNIGAGNVVQQDIAKINESIENGQFYKNEVLVSAINKAKSQGTSVHLMGILSDGGIHSHIVHLMALIKLCHDLGQPKVFIHCFTDGRDSDPMRGLEFVDKINYLTTQLKTGKIATIIGRNNLDRKGNWHRTERVYNLLVNGVGNPEKSALTAVSNSYKKGETDEFIKPTIIDPEGTIKDNDTIIFFNFRSDRTKQLTAAFLNPNFDKFKRNKLNNLEFITFIPYGTEKELGVAAKSAFDTIKIDNTIGKYFESARLKQFHIAETEKYAHVTYFINGNRNDPYEQEERMLIPSPSVHSYAEKPEMSAEEIKNKLITHIKRGQESFTVCNFANGDMVGHTGDFNAAVRAAEFLDKMIKEVVGACVDTSTPLIITADHGNIEQMVDPKTGEPYTEHTNNPVPFIVVSQDKWQLKEGGRLADIAASCLELSGFELPKDFSPSLLMRPQK